LSYVRAKIISRAASTTLIDAFTGFYSTAIKNIFIYDNKSVSFFNWGYRNGYKYASLQIIAEI